MGVFLHWELSATRVRGRGSNVKFIFQSKGLRQPVPRKSQDRYGQALYRQLSSSAPRETTRKSTSDGDSKRVKRKAE